ncbi:mRNA-decapping enzyme [Aureococcus anophagefferens]|uniref:mRNA-decapping enzyme n=2 Tax=Aureococcus anophagefferens TaxID=44056 RepID=A0ABR1FN95_AURAN
MAPRKGAKNLPSAGLTAGGASQQQSLSSLKRVDPEITEILASATHATLYNFASEEWERGDVEGPLFIAKRRSQPRYRLVVLNRLSMSNLVEDVDAGFEIEVVDRYLIFRRADDQARIRGLWFHSLEEHAAIGALLEKVQADAARGRRASPPPARRRGEATTRAPPSCSRAWPSAARAARRRAAAAPRRASSRPRSSRRRPSRRRRAPSLDLEAFKGVLRDLVEDDAFITELHIRYQDKLRS